ncbi:MAG: MBL fold metallo-hydrolase [Omnitrophica bacterium]|nr:MBL fold metallo-hydrolase [Candidatus Omnitrophota bacterium]
MGFEIDFLSVGEGERGGDAIAVRYGNLQGDRLGQVVLVIDGGTKQSGEKLVEHMKKYYSTDRVDLVISTHPDADHSSGLTVILEKMKVDLLWMHRPWEHAQEIKNEFKDGRIAGKGLKGNLKKALENAYELEKLATEKKIPIGEPFSDTATADKQLVILNPSEEFYENLLPHFRETPEPKEEFSIPAKVVTVVKEAINWIIEHWNHETLKDPEENETSAENNTSLIFLLQIDGKKKLFVGDAGVEAIANAIAKSQELGIDLKTADFIQVPHHGSKHNVGPSVLDAILGPKLSEKKHLKTAFVSVPKDGEPKHPSGKVINAFLRRGAKVFATKGSTKLHKSNDAPDRRWADAIPLSFYDKVAE